ncbi:MAG: fibronectin type III domain-containing protein [Gemmataceae bacterium]
MPWTRWLPSRSPRTTLIPRKFRRSILALETLEDRTLLSVLSNVAEPTYIRFTGPGVSPLGSSGPTGYTPVQTRHAYGFDKIFFNSVAGDGTGQTIAIVDAYDDPNISGDLLQFDKQFGLPNPVFTKVNQTGGATPPVANAGWASEIALDVEWAHAIAPKAKILLVEANDNNYNNLLAAVSYAASQPGVVAVSMSWGGGEFNGETAYDSYFTTPSGHAGVTFIASSGDSGAPAQHPAISANVLAVGGTTLHLDTSGNYISESGWSGSGGGISTFVAQPAYQKGIVTQSTTMRTDPDVAYDSDPNTGFPVYDSYNNGTVTPWSQFGGTSAAAPQWAALIAIADQGRAAAGKAALDGPSQTLPLIYGLPATDFHDINSGGSTGIPAYSAAPGYDLVTGRGAPFANLVVPDLVGNLPWSSYAGNAQHTATSTTASQSLDAIHWQTAVDLNPQYSGNDLLIHYGSPLVTAANTVILPVKTGATGGFEVQGINGATGAVKWTQLTDYLLPPHNWTPSFSPVLAPGNRLYFAGAGGTVYYMNSPDATGAVTTGQLAFYGIGNYTHSGFDNSVYINTPLTADGNGNIYFGFQVTGPNPLNLQSGIARIDANGNGSYVSATSAAADAGIIKVVMNNAPALSNDGTKLYVAVSAGNSGRGYLLELNSTTLATVAKRALMDVKVPTNNAQLPDDGTASTTVGPDGDVYFGVLENPFPSNNDRGWLEHFSGDLSQVKTPGAFGWDDTASIVPKSMVPSYTGTSSYLLMTKYNNYAGINTGNGQNRIAILDPNATAVDPVTGATVMKEVLTILGQTADPSHPGGVNEWCINSAAVDPATKSILANSEDGKLYRWDMTTNTFTQVVTLTAGIGEAYTPTVVGTDGTVYAINNATLFAVGAKGSVPAAPSGLSGVPATGSSVNLTWTSTATNQTGFHLDRATDSAFTLNVVTQTLPATPNSFTDTAAGLTPGTTYYYRLRAFNANGDSTNSNVATVAIPQGPAVPTNPKVVNATTTELDLTWTDNAGSNAANYIILRSVNHGAFTTYATLPGKTTAPPSTYSWNDTGLSAGTFYDYHIEASNTTGVSQVVDANATTLTLAPSSVSATPVNSAVNLSWTAPTGAVSYNIYRGTTAGGEAPTAIRTGVTTTTYADAVLTNGATYYYVITAVNANTSKTPVIPSESAKSAEVSATPSSTLSSNLMLTAEDPGTNVYRLLNYNQAGTLLSSTTIPLPPGSTDVEDARDLTVDTAGNIQIFNGTFSPSLSTYARAAQTWSQRTTTGWTTVNNLSYGGVGALRNFVFVTDMATANQPLNGIIRFDNSGGPTVRFADSHDFIDLSVGLDGLVYGLSNTSVPNQVFVYDPQTLGLLRSFALTNGPDTDIRSIAVDASGTIMAATWGGFLVKYDSTGKALANIQPHMPSGAGENYDSITLDPSGQVAAGGRNGFVFLTNESLTSVTSIATNEWNLFVTFDHYIPQAAIPAAPTSLAGAPATASSVNLTWSSTATNQTGFHLDRATDAAFTQNLITESLPGSPNSFTDTAAGLAAGNTYYYRLRSFNAGGDSGNSNTATVTIPAVPAAPTAPQVVSATTGELDLTWTDNAGSNAANYIIMRSVNHGPFTTYATLPGKTGAPPSTYSWNDTGLSAGTFYDYNIEASNTSGTSSVVDANATTLTLPPSTVGATAGNGLVNLSWTAPTGAVSYNVYRGTTAGGEAATAIKTGLTTSNYSDAGVTNGTTYYYVVTAVNANTGNAPVIPSESAKSSEVSAKPASATSATFVKTDTTTQGTWKGVYGVQGYDIIGDAVSLPAYATVTPSGNLNYTWAGSTTAIRALQKSAAGSTDRLAACWYSPTSFTVDLNLTDGQTHQVALYLLDWDNNGRSERIDVLDSASGTVLDSQTASSYTTGKYLVWNLSGHVQIKFTRLTGANTVLSALLLDAPAAPVQPPVAPSGLTGSPATASSVNLTWTSTATNQTGFHLDRATDAAFTQNLVTQSLPSSPNSFTDSAAGLTTGGTYYYRLRASNAAGDSANSNVATVTIPLVPAAPTNPQVVNATTGELDLTWTDNAGANAANYIILRSVNHGAFTTYATLPGKTGAPPSTYSWNDTGLSAGTFYDYNIEASNTSGTSSVIDANATTLTLPPGSVTATAGNGLVNLSWTAPTGAVSYNVYRGTTAGGEAATAIKTGLTATSYSDAGLTNGTTYYYVVTAVNANTANTPVIPSESAKSSEASATPATSGSSSSATFVKVDTTTQGSWKGVYGAQGYDIIGNAASLPNFAAINPNGNLNYTWAASTTNVRALQKSAAGSADRVAACWYSSTSFSVDLNLTDGQTHQVALYLLDWDTTSRSERIDVLDAVSGAMLDSQTASSFTAGKYLVWNLSGHVQIKVTRVAGANAVLSGLFFG